MPYIRQERRMGLREEIDLAVDNFKGRFWTPTVDGDMAFFISNVAILNAGASVENIARILREREGQNEPIEGDINFCISRFLTLYLDLQNSPSYRKINKVSYLLSRAEAFVSHADLVAPEYRFRAAAVLSDVRLELYRRFAAPYEEMKRAEHGDIWE